jgi:hypothetical protein
MVIHASDWTLWRAGSFTWIKFGCRFSADLAESHSEYSQLRQGSHWSCLY